MFKEKALLVLVFLLFFSSIKAQNKQDSLKIKQNSIFFVEGSLGYTNGYIDGLTVGAHFNYQIKKNLFTFRFSQTINIEKLKFFIIIPVESKINTINEHSLLYGKRYVNDGFSYHFSGGISYNVYKSNTGNIDILDRFFGFPLEVGVNWFNSKRERYRLLYGLIPVGKPTSFAKSVGVKLYANIARKSYVGIGMTFGLGWHKKYIE